MVRFEPGSYRDRDGRVFYGGEGEVFRALSPRAFAEWRFVRDSRFFQQGMSQGRIALTSEVDSCPGGALDLDRSTWSGVLRHETIPFVSYPYEWTFGMLRDAALLHLELLEQALAEDFWLKDGTAYNVQWVGPRPVFIDIGSFERLAAGQPWAGYRQFCQTFLYPLFLQAYKAVDFHPLLRGCLDGITPRQCANLMSLRDWFRRGVLSHVVLHARLEGDRRACESDLKRELPRAGFSKAMIQTNVAGLVRTLRKLEWAPAASTWSDYRQSHSYSPADKTRKAAFVHDAVHERPLNLVWDLGCNTGEYSRIAAENARYVVAVDADHLAVERLYRSLKNDRDRGTDRVLPLVGSLADPSPDLGWRGRERRSLAERGSPDLTLCLALIHHLVLGAGIPMRELLEWLAGLGSRLVIEFVDRHDPMVQLLMRNRRDECSDYHAAVFDRWLHEYFDVLRSEPLESGTRTLYYAVSRRGRGKSECRGSTNDQAPVTSPAVP